MSYSVIIPSHNNEKWIKKSIASAIHQKIAPSEIIVVLDRNSDSSEKIIGEIDDERIKIYNTDFGNAASARNLGVSKTSSKWIAFLDGDDWWLPHHAEIAVQTLTNNNNDAYFAHWNEYFNQTGETKQVPSLDFSESTPNLDRNDFYREFLRSNGWPTSGMIFSRKLFDEVGGFDESQLRRHDTELFARIVHRCLWSYNPNPGFCYRKEVAGSISSVYHEVIYFRLLSDLKITRLYNKDLFTKEIRNKAQACAFASALYGDKELREKSSRITRPYIGRIRRIALQTLPKIPAFFLMLARKRHQTQRAATRRKRIAIRIGEAKEQERRFSNNKVDHKA